jgi:predicted enzyme related to lactoylglutathione lyase
MSKHPIIHIEFSAQDRESAAQFYNEVFGWKTSQMPEMNYASFEAEGGPGGGFNPVTEQYPAGTVVVYIATDDIEASLAKVESAGGKAVMPKTEIPEVGWVAMFVDPTGNLVGLYTDINA